MLLLLFATPAWAGELNVRDFGANGADTADDTAAFLKAVAAANPAGLPQSNLYIPAGTYYLSQTIVNGCSPTNSHYAAVSWRGDSQETTRLVSSADPAIDFCRSAYFTVERLAVLSATGSRTDIGIHLGGPGQSGGTQSTVMTFRHVSVGGFGIGMLCGGDEACSELLCEQCVFNGNDIGWTASNYNALNFTFLQSHLTNNRIGIKVGGPWVTDGFHWLGGSTAGNTEADIEFGNGIGIVEIDHVRAEVGPGAKFIKGSWGGHQLLVRGSIIIASCYCAVPVLDMSAFSSATVEHSVVVGQLYASANEGSPILRVMNTQTFEGTPGLPVLMPLGTVHRVYFEGNTHWDAPYGWFPDARGTWDGDSLVSDTQPPPADWTTCATEGGVCAFSGTHEVRYGANGSYVYQTLTGGTACTNAVFGDPIVGTVKACAIR